MKTAKFQKKITLATVKSFIRKHPDNLLISFRSDFDGMTDGIQQSADMAFRKAIFDPSGHSNSLGIKGAWFVGRSRDYFNPYNQDGLTGYEISNCCGSFVLAVKDQQSLLPRDWMS